MTASNVIFARHLAVALVAVAAIFHHTTGVAQPRGRQQDSTAIDSTIRTTGAPLIVTVPRTPTLQSLPDVQGTSLFSGKKSEQISVAQVDGNLAVNNTRQVFSHAAGIQIWEFDGSGIQANVAARGLSPHRSSEFNVRMNGYDIASDPYGYPEVHFTPPFESLERIDVVRGAAALQYGSQFGGLLNYITKSAPPERPIALEASQSGGSYGLYSTYTSLRGTIDQFSYDGYLDFRRSDGWRESGSYWFVTGNGRVTYDISPDARLGLELTAMQFKEHMPNGLTEKQYAENPRASYRPRDWFGAPRIMPALTYDQKISDQTRLSVKAAGLAAERNSITLVTSTAIADTGTNRRRVNRDIFRDASLEARLLTQFDLFNHNRSTLATGFRAARTNTNRSQGLGMDGSDFNLEYRGVKTLDLDFVSYNVAAFGELKIPLADGLAVTPGVRIEHLNTGATGTYAKEKAGTSLFAFDTLGPIRPIDRIYQETFPLFGLGLSA
ncbi:MAG: TonB-dependent receptor, partial [Bacteroidota bacterium]